MKTKTRFAPSPTGLLHIGGARTALFCYLWAHHNKGEFLLRLEDTDIERNIEGGEKNLIDGLTWMGIKPDFSPLHPDKSLKHHEFRQTEKLPRYLEFGNKLLENKKAYKCFCKYDSENEHDKNNLPCGVMYQDENGKYKRAPRKCLDKQDSNEKYSIRVHMPENETYEWNDGVRGKVSFNSNDISDWVAIKSNGIPTYNFANPIDDIDMEITDVMRGEEHISNTPKQIFIYQTFGWKIPRFTHLTIIIGSNGKKLSKRDGSVLQFLEQYEQRGYLPEAVLNFLALLGWSPKEEKEIFTKEELIKEFEIERLSKSPSTFDLEKLKWFNNYYIKNLSKENLISFLSQFIDKEEYEKNKDLYNEIFILFQPGLREGADIKSLSKLFTTEIVEYKLDFLSEIKNNRKLYESFYNILSKTDNWTSLILKEKIADLGIMENVKGKALLRPLRLLFTNEEHGPDLSKIMELFGKEKTLRLLSFNLS